MPRRRSFFAAQSALMAAAFLVTACQQQQARTMPAAVLFYADWCSNCKFLTPKLAQVQPLFDSNKIVTTRLDFSDLGAHNVMMQQQIAASVGAGSIYDVYGAKAGFLVFYDKRTGAELAYITHEKSVSEIETTLKGLVRK